MTETHYWNKYRLDSLIDQIRKRTFRWLYRTLPVLKTKCASMK